jgi:hypothetical protein
MKRSRPDSDDEMNDSQQEVVNDSEEDPEAFNSDDEKDDSEQDFVSDSQEEDPEASKQLLKDIKSQLCNSLEQVSSAMSFASSGPFPTTENPGIWIADVGIIGLPLSERDADLISKVTHPAPYGKGPDTIVDLTFRNTQELNADEFELRNPNWPASFVKRAQRYLKF